MKADIDPANKKSKMDVDAFPRNQVQLVTVGSASTPAWMGGKTFIKGDSLGAGQVSTASPSCGTASKPEDITSSSPEAGWHPATEKIDG